MADTVDAIYDFFDNMSTNFSEYNFKGQMMCWLESWCNKFLDEVLEQIIERDIVDLGGLGESFEKGGKDNIWIERDSGLTIEVGSKNPYGAAVNDGHKTVDPKKASIKLKNGELARWVPGVWSDGRFVHNSSVKTGMLIKQQWIDARPFFTAVERYASEEFAAALYKEFDKWLEDKWE